MNRFAEERKLPMRAISAGAIAGSALNPVVVEAMGEIGFSMDGMKPKPLTHEMVDGAARVITMGCGMDAEACPAGFMVTEDWGLDDPAGQPLEKVREIRDQVRERVERLAESLVSSAK